MDHKRKPTAVGFLTGALTLCVMFGTSFSGVYHPVSAAFHQTDQVSGQEQRFCAEGDVVIPVDFKKVAKKRIVWLGEYTLSKGDKICYDISAKTGKGMQIGFVKSGDKQLNTTYYSVKNRRQKGEPLKCTADLTFGPPVKRGTYKLFLRATGSTLKNVKGSVSIVLRN